MVLCAKRNGSFPCLPALIASVLMASGASAYSQNIRLMPLGASITEGFRSTTGNGYRGPLREQLVTEVESVDFVGSKRNGTMSDADNEGHSGLRIDQIAGLAHDVLVKYRPNVVTLLVGTNDMGQNYQVSNAPARLGALIDQVLADAPDATVLVSEIVPSSDAAIQARIAAYNAQIPGLVQVRANAGKHVAFVSLNTVTTSDLDDDGIHPDDGGYQKIANAWNTGIKKVILNGWIKNPVPTGALPSNGPHILRPQSSPSMVLDDFGSSTKAGNQVDIWTANGSGAQSWVLSNTNVSPAGYYNIAVSFGPYCLTASGSNSGAVAHLQACNGSAAQAWRAVPSGIGYTFNPASNTSLCLDVKSSGTAPGTLVQVWSCNGTKAQQWEVK